MKSSGSNTTWVVPSRYGVFKVQHPWPWPVSESRSVAIAGVAI